ncbi:MAG: NAD(+)/NADH kinase [Clostridia bacterium]
MRTVGVLVNPQKMDGHQAMSQVCAACTAAGLHARAVNTLDDVALQQMLSDVDALLVLGGDGTILHAVEHIVRYNVPILGINFGHLGFLTEVGPQQMEQAMCQLAAGAYQLEPRMLLEMAMEEKLSYALNDVVVSRGGYARLITVDAYVEEEWVGRYLADGMVVASPTGSTGYSLSAGGPIIAPSMQCMLLTPICPHTLQARPLVVDAQAHICLRVRCPEMDGGMLVTVDGRKPVVLSQQAEIFVRRADATLSFIRLKPHNFYDRLRNKLTEWSR